MGDTLTADDVGAVTRIPVPRRDRTSGSLSTKRVAGACSVPCAYFIRDLLASLSRRKDANLPSCQAATATVHMLERRRKLPENNEAREGTARSMNGGSARSCDDRPKERTRRLEF